MDREKLPRLCEEDVLRLADEQSFARGKAYYRDGAIQNPVIQEREMRAECAGSRYEPYRVRVAFGENGVTAASCTCPRGGFCKHLVALLLTYVHRPDSFRTVPSLAEMLSQLDKDSLITLIRDMVEREPALLSMVELAATLARGGGVDGKTYRREALRAMQHEDPDAVEADLSVLVESARRLSGKGDWLNAGTIYQAVLDALVDGYEDDLQGMDEEGDIAVIADDCAEGLAECLSRGRPDPATRQSWLDTLLEAVLAEAGMGIDFASGAEEALFEHATAEEWAVLDEQVREALTENKSEWTREHLLDLMVGWRMEHGRGEEAEALIRELGTPRQRMFLAAREGKTDEAVALARSHFLHLPGVVIELADVLVENNAAEQAAALIAGQVEGGKDYSTYLEWLVKYHQERGETAAAISCQRRLFLQQPSVKMFTALRQVAQESGDWPKVRAEVLESLEKNGKNGALIDLALHEGNVARALELVSRREGWGWVNYRLKVANAAGKNHPEAAIGLYRELVEAAVGQRKRTGYQEAAGYLKRIRNLHQRLGSRPAWEEYIGSLRRKYARFPALQEELDRAGL